jgi:hypothetical protein
MKANRKSVQIMSQCIIIWIQGAAMNVTDRDGSKFVQKWYNVYESVPRITLLVNQGFTAKELGPVMKKAKKSIWDNTDNPLISTPKIRPLLRFWLQQ